MSYVVKYRVNAAKHPLDLFSECTVCFPAGCSVLPSNTHPPAAKSYSHLTPTPTKSFLKCQWWRCLWQLNNVFWLNTGCGAHPAPSYLLQFEQTGFQRNSQYRIFANRNNDCLYCQHRNSALFQANLFVSGQTLFHVCERKSIIDKVLNYFL